MKYRADFVTNSSSTSYTVITVTFANGRSAKVSLDGFEWLDYDGLFESAPFLKDIQSVDKLAAYLVCAYDEEAHDIEVTEIPASGSYYMAGFDGRHFTKIFIESGRDRDGAKLVKFVENIVIDTMYGINKRDLNVPHIKNMYDNRTAFIETCKRNAGTIQDIAGININHRIVMKGESHYIDDAVFRIAEENGIGEINRSVYDVASDAMFNTDYPEITTEYNIDMVENRHSHKTEYYIKTDWCEQIKPVIRIDKKHKFYSVFNMYSGEYFRSGIIQDGKDTGINPFMASFPHLIDVGIMGHCSHGKAGRCPADCYQSGTELEMPNMSIEDFREIACQSAGRVDQFALGGRGDPDQHEYFAEILDICVSNMIVPNFTTSGYGLTPEIAGKCWQCGAVAVSWYRSDYTLNAIQMLLYNGVKTNIHYVLSNSTIDEAIRRLDAGDFPKGINAVIFLLHKPVGMGKGDKVLRYGDPRLKRFFELIDKGGQPFKTGIDSCTTPGIINNCSNVLLESIDKCEAGRFSCYISSDMQIVPCSFDQEGKYGLSLRGHTIERAWNSEEFNTFRQLLKGACQKCGYQTECMGGCPLIPDIVLCDRSATNHNF